MITKIIKAKQVRTLDKHINLSFRKKNKMGTYLEIIIKKQIEKMKNYTKKELFSICIIVLPISL
jgi:hypothetical protein